MRKRVKIALSVFAAAVVSTLTVTGVNLAHADVDATYTYPKTAVHTTASPPGDAPCEVIWGEAGMLGKVCFAAYGDRIWLKDNMADGAVIRTSGFHSPSGHQYKCAASKGSDGGWQYCGFSKEMPEGGIISLTGYAMKHGSEIGSSAPMYVPN